MNKNPIYRSEEETKDIACGNVATELDENSLLLDWLSETNICAGWTSTWTTRTTHSTASCTQTR